MEGDLRIPDPTPLDEVVDSFSRRLPVRALQYLRERGAIGEGSLFLLSFSDRGIGQELAAYLRKEHGRDLTVDIRCRVQQLLEADEKAQDRRANELFEQLDQRFRDHQNPLLPELITFLRSMGILVCELPDPEA